MDYNTFISDTPHADNNLGQMMFNLTKKFEKYEEIIKDQQTQLTKLSKKHSKKTEESKTVGNYRSNSVKNEVCESKVAAKMDDDEVLKGLMPS